MPDTPKFFVPPDHLTPEQQESAYAEFAAMCHQPVAEPGRRIYSITYVHDGEEWTATVGETLRGVSHKTVTKRGAKIPQTSYHSDPAVVLAIFSDSPYFVVTSKGFWTSSEWARKRVDQISEEVRADGFICEPGTTNAANQGQPKLHAGTF